MQVCLGFVENLDENGVPQRITDEFVLNGHYEIDIAGIRSLNTLLLTFLRQSIIILR